MPKNRIEGAELSETNSTQAGVAYSYRMDLTEVDWGEMKRKLTADNFDNGRSPEQLAASFRNSQVTVIAYAGDEIIGTVRALSDGVCNAYVVDVWTWRPYRHRGVATRMMELALEQLPGQHVYLFTDSAADLYRKLGFSRSRHEGFERVMGRWLDNRPLSAQ